MSDLQIFQQQDFSGGLNLRSDQFQLADNESPLMLNVEIDPRGGIFGRGGMERINTTAVPSAGWTPHKLFTFRAATGPKIMLTENNNVFYSTGGNFTKLQWNNAGTPTDVTTVSDHGACMTPWGNVMYFATGATGSNGGYKWTGTGYATQITATGQGPHPWQDSTNISQSVIPQAEHYLTHANKLFAAYVSEPPEKNLASPIVTYPNRLRWSREGVPENWDYEDYIDINGGGDGIHAIIVVQGQLLIFKPRAIYVLTGYNSSNFAVTELTSTLGVDDHHCVAASDSGCFFFVHGKGLYYYNGSSISDIFAPLKPIIDLGYISDSVAARKNITVSWVGQRLWLSLPYSKSYSPTNITVNFVYDPYLNAYTQFQTADGYGVMGGIDFIDSTNREYRLFIHPVQKFVLDVDKYGVATDNISGTTQGFNSYYRTKWYDAGSYMQRKMFRRPEIVIKESNNSQTIGVSVFHDFDEQEAQRTFNISQPQTGGLVWDSGLWGELWAAGAESSRISKGKNLGLAKTIQLQFTGPTGQEWGINSVGFKFKPRRVTG